MLQPDSMESSGALLGSVSFLFSFMSFKFKKYSSICIQQ